MVYQNGEGAPHCVDSGDAQECVGWRARPISNKSDRSETQPLRAELIDAIKWGRAETALAFAFRRAIARRKAVRS